MSSVFGLNNPLIPIYLSEISFIVNRPSYSYRSEDSPSTPCISKPDDRTLQVHARDQAPERYRKNHIHLIFYKQFVISRYSFVNYIMYGAYINVYLCLLLKLCLRCDSIEEEKSLYS